MADRAAYLYAMPDRPVRVVAVEPLSGGRSTQAFYSTRADASAEEVLTWFAMHWSIEETFRNAKSHLGFEEPQAWTKRAVERIAPTAMTLYSLVVLWFAGCGHRSYRPQKRPWYRSKSRPAFTDMLATLRQETVREHVLRLRPTGCDSRNLMKTLLCSVQQAA